MAGVNALKLNGFVQQLKPRRTSITWPVKNNLRKTFNQFAADIQCLRECSYFAHRLEHFHVSERKNNKKEVRFSYSKWLGTWDFKYSVELRLNEENSLLAISAKTATGGDIQETDSNLLEIGGGGIAGKISNSTWTDNSYSYRGALTGNYEDPDLLFKYKCSNPLHSINAEITNNKFTVNLIFALHRKKTAAIDKLLFKPFFAKTFDVKAVEKNNHILRIPEEKTAQS